MSIGGWVLTLSICVLLVGLIRDLIKKDISRTTRWLIVILAVLNVSVALLTRKAKVDAQLREKEAARADSAAAAHRHGELLSELQRIEELLPPGRSKHDSSDGTRSRDEQLRSLRRSIDDLIGQAGEVRQVADHSLRSARRLRTALERVTGHAGPIEEYAQLVTDMRARTTDFVSSGEMLAKSLGTMSDGVMRTADAYEQTSDIILTDPRETLAKPECLSGFRAARIELEAAAQTQDDALAMMERFTDQFDAAQRAFAVSSPSDERALRAMVSDYTSRVSRALPVFERAAEAIASGAYTDAIVEPFRALEAALADCDTP